MISMLWMFLVSVGVGWVAEYVLCGIAFSSLMRKRGIKHWGVAWVPLLNVSYAVGRLSDHISADYRRRTHRALLLLFLQILSAAASIILVLWAAPELTEMVKSAMEQGMSLDAFSFSQRIDISSIGFALPLMFVVMALSLAQMILQYLSFFNIYREYAPAQAMLYMIIVVMVKVFFGLGLMAPIFVLAIRNYPSQFSVLNSKKAF